MADSQNGLYLIAYDIADPKRLSRVHRTLKKQGLPVQYSVFIVAIKRKSLLRLLESIELIIQPAEDDIRCYRLPEQSDIRILGRQFFPEGVMLFTDGINQLFIG
ncbi:MAG: CRISPR-associated endonuclease Cas2 [Methylococcaceae bacterium]